ncbi:MAG TPA: hypothetical protein VG672_24840, partial [Bryobacteraceae bacterium]|nr:hypothetical protein [Bryobacteraceae bacterium]
MGKIPLFACVLIPMALEAQTVSPASAVFNYLVGSTLPATQSLSVKPAAGATSSTYVATAAPAHSWLIVTPGTGRLPGSLKLAVNPTSLTAGTYTGTVTITVSGAATSLTVNVTLNVTSDSPMLILSSTALSFTAPPGPTAQTVLVTATSGAIPFSATTGTSWLSVSAPQLLALPGQQIPLTVSVDPAALNPQATPYSGKITVTASGVPKTNATQTITVSLTVQTMTPAIASIWPSQLPVMASTGSTTAGQTITIHGTN